jgi:hypothetical protein
MIDRSLEFLARHRAAEPARRGGCAVGDAERLRPDEHHGIVALLERATCRRADPALSGPLDVSTRTSFAAVLTTLPEKAVVLADERGDEGRCGIVIDRAPSATCSTTPSRMTAT